jgi:hypothetical protein
MRTYKKEKPFNVETIPKHLQHAAVEYMLQMRKATWKGNAIRRLEHHRDHSFRARATTFRRGQELFQRTIGENQQREQFVEIQNERIRLVTEEETAIQQAANALRLTLVDNLTTHIRQEKEQAYRIVGLDPAALAPETRQRNERLITEEVFNALAELGKQLVRLRAEANADLEKWMKRQNERVAQRQARIQMDEDQPAQAHAERRQPALQPSMETLIRREVKAQLKNAGRGRRATPNLHQNARRRSRTPTRTPSRSRSRSGSRNGSRSRSNRSRSSSRVTFRTPNNRNRRTSRSNSSRNGRHAHVRTGSASFGRGRGRAGSWTPGRGNRGRGRRGRANLRGRF